MSNQSEDRVLGTVGIYIRGAYDNTVQYEYMNQVTYEGSSYTCINEKGCIGIEPTNEEYWICSSQKGDKGDKGDKGEKGDTYQVTQEDLQAIADNITADANSKFNTNVEEKTNTFNTNAESKTTEYNNNHTAKIEEYDAHAEGKIAEFDNNVDSLENELTELAGQMPWNTTDIQESIHVEDAWKYSRNKLFPLGNLKQETREGYNKFNIETITENKYITTTGVLGESEVSNTSDFIPVTANTTHTVFFDYETLANESQRTYCLYNSNKTVLSGVQYTPSNKKITINPTEDGYLRFTYDINCTNIQCIEGTEEKTYEQYGAMPSIEYPSMPSVATGVQTIRKCKKNCYDISKFNTNVKMTNFSGHWIYLKPNTTYTISTNMVSNADEGNGLQPMLGNPTNGNAYIVTTTDTTAISLTSSHGVGTINNKTRTVVTGETGAIFIGSRNAVNSLQNMVAQGGYIQIEPGDTATPYKPYSEEIFSLDLEDKELAQIKDSDGNVITQDKLVYREVDGIWKHQWVKVVGKYKFDGTETITIQETNTNTIRFKVDKTLDFATLDNKTINYYSNRFRSYSYTNRTNDVEGIFIGKSDVSTEIYIRIPLVYNILTVEDFKTFVQENDVYLYYVLHTPTYEDCTQAQSEVLDKLHKLSLAKGTNNIFVESENGVTVELQLEYMQDNNLVKEQEHQEIRDEIDVLKQAILSLGGNI